MKIKLKIFSFEEYIILLHSQKKYFCRNIGLFSAIVFEVNTLSKYVVKHMLTTLGL